VDVRGKRILVVGLARSGRAAAIFLRRQGAAVTVTDSRPPWNFNPEIRELVALNIGLELGTHREETFLNQDLVVVSPGVPWDLPPLRQARARGIPVVPEVEAASWFLKGTLIGITGSNGKTTTTTLLGRMLEASGFDTLVGGNIGVPLISLAEESSADTLTVAELSSFQLEAVQNFRVHIAVLLNITPNHLDRHASFEAYTRAKAGIFRGQTHSDYAVLNADDPVVMSLAPAIVSRKVYFSRRQNLPDGVLVSNGKIIYRVENLEAALMDLRDVRLRGEFNLENVLAAAAAACVCGASFDAIRRAVRNFAGVEHRLEYVASINQVDFYNDSKATSVDATAKALSAFERGVHLILGGKDKGAPYTPLLPWLKGRVREVLLIGSAAERIAEELGGAVELVRAGDLETAVRIAFEQAKPGDTILLAPACASFDQFQDFEHRGRVFKELVKRLAATQTASSAQLQADAGPARIPEPRLLRRLEPVHFFEVSGEEFAPLALSLEVGAGWQDQLASLDLRPLEPPDTDPMLYEVGVAASRPQPEAVARGAASSRKGEGQGRLPGI
jgi:UDP-N-acetylmuramoylalanine--D-glutamate ligase